MVGGDHIDHIIPDRFTDRIPVTLCFNRRVTLDAVATFRVILIAEPEVVHAGFSGNAFTRQIASGKQRQLFLSGQVQYVQVAAVLFGQLHRHRT